MVRPATREDLGDVEIRTVAGPSSVVQCVLSGGPYTVSSHVRHVQLGCDHRHARGTLDAPRGPSPGPRVCPLGRRVGGWAIRFRVVA
jgi:hypothetical protein